MLKDSGTDSRADSNAHPGPHAGAATAATIAVATTAAIVPLHELEDGDCSEGYLCWRSGDQWGQLFRV